MRIFHDHCIKETVVKSTSSYNCGAQCFSTHNAACTSMYAPRQPAAEACGRVDGALFLVAPVVNSGISDLDSRRVE